MPTFSFYGRTTAGKPISGERAAHSADSLSAQLNKEGITPIKIAEAEKELSAFKQLKTLVKGRSTSSEELTMFSRQMYTLIKAGVSLTSGLHQLSKNARSSSLANALNGLVENLEAGQDLASSMQDYPDIFTPLMVSMVKVGQNSGKLDDAFLKLNQYLEMETTTIKRVKTALRYPVFVIIAIVVAVIMINIFVIPTFAGIFAQANMPLPGITQFLIHLSTFLKNYWFINVLILASIVGGVIYYLKTPTGKYKWHRTQIKLPVIGPVIRRIIMLRFTQSFSLVVSAGVPVIEGLGLVAYTLENDYATEEILTIQTAVQRGKSLTQAVAEIDLFTPLELQMLAVSEETGELAAMLDQLSLYYKREVDYDLKKLSDTIEPILLISLSIIILMLALSVYLPIWNMVKMAG